MDSMPRKPKTAPKAKPKSKAKHARVLPRFLAWTSVLAAALFCGFSDWYVHQPHDWQQEHAKKAPAPLVFAFTRLGNEVADTTDSLGLTGRDAVADLDTPLPTNRVVCAGLPKRLPACKAPDDITVLNKRGFVVGYSPSLRHPVWVAYKVYPAGNRTPPPRPALFKPDPAAPHSPQHKEYAKSGYDRGHMAPNLAIATCYGKAAQEQTFQTSNICPQRPSLNQGPWADAEYRIADLWPDCYGDVWVITGALSTPADSRLASGIDVPTAFYQVVVAQKNGKIRAFAVCMPQTLHRHTPARTTLISIDDLEKLTGFDFLADLPVDVQKDLEAQTPTRLWPTGFAGYGRLILHYVKTLRY
jgi:endonuclease G